MLGVGTQTKPRFVLPCVRKPSVILEPPEMPRFGQKLLWITLVTPKSNHCFIKSQLTARVIAGLKTSKHIIKQHLDFVDPASSS